MGQRVILVCLDGSPFGEAGLTYAIPIAQATGAELLLLEVLELVPRSHPGPVDSVGVEIARAEASHYLHELAPTLKGRGIAVRTETAEGRPAEQILHVAERESAELIVLGSHGRREATRFRLGSTAHQVVNQARQSILLVRPPQHDAPLAPGKGRVTSARIERALVLLDGSAAAEAVLPSALSMAREVGTELVLSYIIVEAHLPCGGPPSRGDSAMVERFSQRSEELARGYLRGVERTLRAQGAQCRVALSTSESIRTGVLGLATDEDVDLVMITSHGQTSSDRVTHGSVTQQLLLHAQIPVWVVQSLRTAARRFEPAVSMESRPHGALRLL